MERPASAISALSTFGVEYVENGERGEEFTP
jgi:hypothetical protein